MLKERRLDKFMKVMITHDIHSLKNCKSHGEMTSSEKMRRMNFKMKMKFKIVSKLAIITYEICLMDV